MPAKKYPRATEDQFVATRFHDAKDKMLTVNATVRFLESGMDPAKFTKRAYHFFHQTLSMSACYDRHGFIWQHLRDDQAKAQFLEEARRCVSRFATLDPERNSDMTELFSAEGPYADLLR